MVFASTAAVFATTASVSSAVAAVVPAIFGMRRPNVWTHAPLSTFATLTNGNEAA